MIFDGMLLEFSPLSLSSERNLITALTRDTNLKEEDDGFTVSGS